MSAQMIVFGVIGLAFLGLMAFRLRGLTKPREVKVDQLWIAPALFGAGAIYLISRGPVPGPAVTAVWALALILGLGLGWVRAKTLRIEVHPETAAVQSQASPAALLLIVALVVARVGVRAWLLRNPSAVPLDAAHLTDGFIVLAVGAVAGQRLEMWLRARKLLAARVAAPAS